MDHINNLYRQIQDSRVVQSTRLFLNTPIGKSVAIGIIIALGFYLLRGSWYPKLFSAKKLDGQQKDGASIPGALPTHPHQTTPSRPDSTFIDDDFPLLSESATKQIPPEPLPRPQRNNSGASSNGPPPKVPPRRGIHQRSLSSPLNNISNQPSLETVTNTPIPPPAPPLPIPRALPSSSSVASSASPAQAKHPKDVVRTTSTADILLKRSFGLLALAEIQLSTNRPNTPSSRPPSGNYDDWDIEYTDQQEPLTDEIINALAELSQYANSPQQDGHPILVTFPTPSSHAIDQTTEQSSSTEQIGAASSSGPSSSIGASSKLPTGTPSSSFSSHPPPHLDPKLVKRLSSRRLSTQDTVVVKKTKQQDKRRIPNFEPLQPTQGI